MVAERVFFRCQRSGNCCRVGTGRVWLRDGEAEALAQAVGMSAAAFAAQKLVWVDGRLSLRERADGRCVLLEGTHHCTAYAARPQQCRDFPDWPHLQQDGAELARAAAYCPGLQRLPGRELRERGRQALDRILEAEPARAAASAAERDPGGRAPCLAATGRRPVSALEADRFLEAFPATSPDRGGPCPALDGARCTAGPARPAICRNFAAEEGSAVEQEIQAAAEVLGYPWSKADWSLILPDRAAAWMSPPPSLSPLDV